MNLLWRTLLTILFPRVCSPVGLFDEISIFFRVLPTDIDVLGHMNNGRYFSFMDLARLNLLIRNKTISLLKKNKIYAVIASEMIRFKKSLNLFQRFEITTRILGWDDKFIYVIHHFKKENEIYALSLVKIRMLGKGAKKISPQEVLELMGENIESPAMPQWVIDWQRADKAFYDETVKAKETST